MSRLGFLKVSPKPVGPVEKLADGSISFLPVRATLVRASLMIATSVRCPKGHVWDPAEFDDDPAPDSGPIACPYCGALCSSSIGPAYTDPTPPAADDPDAPPPSPVTS